MDLRPHRQVVDDVREVAGASGLISRCIVHAIPRVQRAASVGLVPNVEREPSPTVSVKFWSLASAPERA